MNKLKYMSFHFINNLPPESRIQKVKMRSTYTQMDSFRESSVHAFVTCMASGSAYAYGKHYKHKVQCQSCIESLVVNYLYRYVDSAFRRKRKLNSNFRPVVGSVASYVI